MLGHGGCAVSRFRATMPAQVGKYELVAISQLRAYRLPEFTMNRKWMQKDYRKAHSMGLEVDLRVVARKLHVRSVARCRTCDSSPSHFDYLAPCAFAPPMI